MCSKIRDKMHSKKEGNRKITIYRSWPCQVFITCYDITAIVISFNSFPLKKDKAFKSGFHQRISINIRRFPSS